MQSATRQQLGLIVERGERIASYNFAKHYNQSGIQTNLSINFNSETGMTVAFDQNAPDEEAITALAANLRYFTQRNENICLYSDSWLIRRSPQVCAWLSDDGLSQEWLKHWSGVQRYINERLSLSTVLNYHGTIITYGVVYEVVLYGDVIHSTKSEQLKQWRSDPIVNAIVTDALYSALGTVLDGIRILTQATECELKGGQMTPWDSLFNTRYPKRRRLK